MAIYRQGDVLIAKIDSSLDTSTLTPIPRERGSVVLAHGEVTGHSHRIPSRSARLYRDESDRRFLLVGGGAPVVLRHEEHSPIRLPPGAYRVTIQREYEAGEIVQVVD